jgi:predicted nuclease of predicted toxin-antitoxin system
MNPTAPRKLLLDESVDVRLKVFLTAIGHDVLAIGIDYPAALSDNTVLSTAVSGDRILITNDRDFGDLIFKSGRPHRGVIYLRLRNRRPDHALSRIQDVITRFADRLDEFIVVTDYMVRPRGKPTSNI